MKSFHRLFLFAAFCSAAAGSIFNKKWDNNKTFGYGSKWVRFQDGKPFLKPVHKRTISGRFSPELA